MKNPRTELIDIADKLTLPANDDEVKQALAKTANRDDVLLIEAVKLIAELMDKDYVR